jgi:hypothetical protein
VPVLRSLVENDHMVEALPPNRADDALPRFNVTANPTAEWTGQQLREAFPSEQIPRYLLRDRDSMFGVEFRKRIWQPWELKKFCRRRARRGSEPKRIVAAHFAVQFSHVFKNRRPAKLAATNLPGPEQPEASTIAGNDGFRLGDGPGKIANRSKLCMAKSRGADRRTSVWAASRSDGERRIGAEGGGSPTGVWLAI